eukprot:9831771-Lingulodinium_polyedra.AAC.1
MTSWPGLSFGRLRSSGSERRPCAPGGGTSRQQHGRPRLARSGRSARSRTSELFRFRTAIAAPSSA